MISLPIAGCRLPKGVGRLASLLLCIVLPALFSLPSGCLDATRHGVRVDPQAERSTASDAELFQALAERVERGRFEDTDQVLRVVQELHAAGDLKHADRLESAIPGAASQNQPLDSDAARREIANRLRVLP